MDVIRNEKRMRLCSDNINFWIKESDECHSKHSHMEHYFGSIAIFHHMNLSGLSEKKKHELNQHLWQHLISSSIHMTTSLATMPYLQCKSLFSALCISNFLTDLSQNVAQTNIQKAWQRKLKWSPFLPSSKRTESTLTWLTSCATMPI